MQNALPALFVPWLVVTAAASAALPPVSAPLRPVTQTYHGTTVTDPYQWLEVADAPEVVEWSRQQNLRTRGYLDQLPFRAGLAQHIESILGEQSARYTGLQRAGKAWFALRLKPPAQQPALVLIASLFPPALVRTVFDPNVYNPQGTTAIDWFEPSPDGTYVAVCLSDKGSEDGSLHFFETATGRKLADVVPRVQYPTGGGSVAWTRDGRMVLYTRYPHAGERPDADLNFFQQVWRHRLGDDPASDAYEIGREFPRIAEIKLQASHDHERFLAAVANGDGGDFAHYLRERDGRWRPLTRFADGVKQAVFGTDGSLYLRSLKDAPHGCILRLAPDAPALADAELVVREGQGVILDFKPIAEGLFVENLQGGPSELLYYRHGRRSGIRAPLLPVSSVDELQSLGGDEVVFSHASYVQPAGFNTWRPGEKALRATALKTTAPVDFADIEVRREFAVSRDGTRVPVNILMRRGTPRDGKNPLLLYGYGGYGISLSPGFNPLRRVWFDAGGIYVVANLRGGGEYGAEWHTAGNLTHKQNVFDDFIACAEHLIHRGYTSSARLAVEGGSNGGLLMGAFLTQRPELAQAVVAHVGIYDMLRVELDPNGQFNVTEFGTVKDASQFAALYAYSPYHRVKDGTAYPAVLLATGENDGRVNPAHSRKMTARLQAATASERPVLYRSVATAGHGHGSSLRDRAALQADVYAFLFDQLGMDATAWTWR